MSNAGQALNHCPTGAGAGVQVEVQDWLNVPQLAQTRFMSELFLESNPTFHAALQFPSYDIFLESTIYDAAESRSRRIPSTLVSNTG